MPLIATALALIASPRLAAPLQQQGWGAHLLGVRTIAMIESGLDIADRGARLEALNRVRPD